ncbi:MAG: TadE/TadG family type IV pilus assembly protein, partial [Phycisphaeraceae bacterium]
MKPTLKPTSKKVARKRSVLGAVMAETVLVMPFIMLAMVLIIYLGWNFRRLAQVTNMDRYAVWELATPGSPGPDLQGIQADLRNPRLNNAFFGLNGDQALTLDELRSSQGYTPQPHENLRDQQTDETYAYFDDFLENNPRAIHQRFTARHDHSIDLERFG